MTDQAVRLLELGCGEAQIIGALVEGHAQVRDIQRSVGIDYIPRSIETCRRRYPQMTVYRGRFHRSRFAGNVWATFELVLLVNALHEVFTAGFSAALGAIDVPAAKLKAENALVGAVGRLAPGGYLVLFDGLEMPGDPDQMVRLRFQSRLARQHFDTFAREYHPFHITFREVGSPFPGRTKPAPFYPLHYQIHLPG